MSKTITATRTPANVAAIARNVDEDAARASATVEAVALRESLGAAQSAPARRDSVAEANSANARRIEYKPRESLFRSDAQRQIAAHVGPVFFQQLVREWDAAHGQPYALAAESAAAVIGLYDYIPRADGNGERAVPHTPASFANALARRVSRGEAFMEDIAFDEPVQKGGTLAEHLYNGARLVALRAEKGEVSRATLDPDVRAALVPAGAGNGTPSAR